MKQALNRPMDKLEIELMEQAIANGGHLDLDLTNPVHYRFYVNDLGGEELLKKETPCFFNLLQRQVAFIKKSGMQASPDFLADAPPLPLEDYEIIDRVDTEMRSYSTNEKKNRATSSNSYFHILGVPKSSYSTLPVTAVLMCSKIMDYTTGTVIAENEDYVYPDDGYDFTSCISCDVPEESGTAIRPYRTSCTFSTFSATQNGDVWLTAGYSCSVSYTVSAKNDINSIELEAPVILHADKRTEHTDEICISYERDSQLESPDYHFDVNLDHVIGKLPVNMDFSFTVELRNDAYFYVDDRGSYFSKDSDPQIYLFRFDNDENQPISAGRATLYQDWIHFTSANVIPVGWTEDNHVNKLRLVFPEDWNSNLQRDDFFNVSTYTYFSAQLAFNTCNKDTSSKKPDDYHKLTTTIFVRFQDNPNKRQNPTPAGENQVHVAHIFYQWGCFGENTLLDAPGRPIAAKDVTIGAVLLNREGVPVTVRNIYTGNDKDILHIVHEKGSVDLSEGHTVFDETGTPLTAGCVTPGMKLLYRNSETGLEEAVTVTECIYIPYGKTVYNFEFEQPQYLIADGLIAGDYGWQQKVRKPVMPLAPRPDNEAIRQAGAELQALIARKRGTPMAAPAPVFSDTPECMPLHYFAVKALARYDNLYTEEEAQAIAEYCQYLSDNATTGGLRVDQIPDDLNESGLWTLYSDESGSGFIVPIIPTAMEKWYDDAELDKEKPWLLPPNLDEKNRTYNMITDVLTPFHYPPGDTSSQTEFDSTYIEKMLKRVAFEASEKGITPNALMAMGTAIHLLLDSMLHESFSPERSWHNLGRVGQVTDTGGSDVTGQFPPYKNYPFEKYSRTASYPAGIQQNGTVSQVSWARYDYTFPRSEGELDQDELGYSKYTGYHAPVNPDRYVRACKRMMEFLVSCKDKRFDEVTWKNTLSMLLKNAFYSEEKSFDKQKEVWTKAFPKINFRYDKAGIYSRMVNGDSKKESTLEKYDEFFRYTMMLYRLKEEKILMAEKRSSLTISYDLNTPDTLCVTAGIDKVTGYSSGILELSIMDPSTGQILQENSVFGVIPVSCMLDLDITGASENGAVYRATARWTPIEPEPEPEPGPGPEPGPAPTPEPAPKEPEAEAPAGLSGSKPPKTLDEQLLITVDGWKNHVLLDCDYTLVSKRIAGSDPRYTLEDAVFYLSAADGYELVGPQEDVILEYPSPSQGTVSYQGEIICEENQVSFPDKQTIPAGSSIPLSLAFSCTAAFQKTGKPNTCRKAVIHYKPK